MIRTTTKIFELQTSATSNMQYMYNVILLSAVSHLPAESELNQNMHGLCVNLILRFKLASYSH